MARIFTLGALVERCKQRADLEHSAHVEDPEWKTYVSSVFAELYEILVESGLRYYEAVQSIASASLIDNGDGGGYIALPSDYLGTLGVDYAPTTGARRALVELMAQERNIYSSTSAGASEARAYALVGANLILYPKPPTGQAYKHVYVPLPAELSSAADATSVDVVVPAGEDFVIWGAARIALAKEESDTSVAEREFARARERIQGAAQNRILLAGRRRVVDDLGLEPADGDWWPSRRGW